VLWGYCWRDCKSKWILIVYTFLFAITEAIAGSRGYFIFPLIFFGIGFAVSGALPRWNVRQALKVGLLGGLAMWSFAKSEDIRNIFSRGEVTDASEAIQRIESVTDSNASESVNYLDGSGMRVNSFFRIGSRLFELSAADVIARTPSAVDFYGWTDDDWSVFLTGFLPLGLNRNAAYYSSEGSGVFYLRSYGWYIDPYSEIRDTSTSMPATLAGDSFRRFGWPGVVIWFLIWPWSLARLTQLLRFRPGRYTIQILASALLVDIAQDYTSDVTTLAASIPRRLLLLWLYGMGLSLLVERGAPATSGLTAGSTRVLTAVPGIDAP
jgi:hypothetical protein